jgi:hypothetical protein
VHALGRAGDGAVEDLRAVRCIGPAGAGHQHVAHLAAARRRLPTADDVAPVDLRGRAGGGHPVGRAGAHQERPAEHLAEHRAGVHPVVVAPDLRGHQVGVHRQGERRRRVGAGEASQDRCRWEAPVPSGYGQCCPISRALEVLGERWSLLIVRDLLVGTTRFNDLARGCPGCRGACSAGASGSSRPQGSSSASTATTCSPRPAGSCGPSCSAWGSGGHVGRSPIRSPPSSTPSCSCGGRTPGRTPRCCPTVVWSSP